MQPQPQPLDDADTIGKVGRFLVPACNYTPAEDKWEYGTFVLGADGVLDFEFEDKFRWGELSDMPELRAVAADMIASALAHPKPTAVRQAIARRALDARMADAYEDLFQRDAAKFHRALDAMSVLWNCACCGEERGSQHFSDKVYGEDCELLEPIQHRLVRVRVRSESMAHLGTQGGVLDVGSRVTIRPRRPAAASSASTTA